MALALLPAEMIINAFKQLVIDCREDFGDIFEEFFVYYESQWILTVTPKYFSIHGEINRTNNFLESFHSLLKSIFGKRPLIELWIGAYWIKNLH